MDRRVSPDDRTCAHAGKPFECTCTPGGEPPYVPPEPRRVELPLPFEQWTRSRLHDELRQRNAIGIHDPLYALLDSWLTRSDIAIFADRHDGAIRVVSRADPRAEKQKWKAEGRLWYRRAYVNAEHPNSQAEPDPVLDATECPGCGGSLPSDCEVLCHACDSSSTATFGEFSSDDFDNPVE